MVVVALVRFSGSMDSPVLVGELQVRELLAENPLDLTFCGCFTSLSFKHKHVFSYLDRSFHVATYDMSIREHKGLHHTGNRVIPLVRISSTLGIELSWTSLPIHTIHKIQ